MNEAAIKLGIYITISLVYGVDVDPRAYIHLPPGRDFATAALMEPFLQDAGFADIHHEKMKIPYGTWPADRKQKEMGAYLLLTADTAFSAFAYGLLTRASRMDIEEVDELVRLARTDSKSRKVHSYARQ